MTKLINLDELVSAARTVKYKGKEYPVQDLPVLEFVKAQRAVDEMSKSFEAEDVAAVLKHAETVIGLAIPSFPKEEFAKLNMRQITATVSLVMDSYPDAGEEAGKAQEAAGNA